MPKIKDLIISLRPKQWIKNFFVFVPMIFSAKILSGYIILYGFFTFVFFCLLSSAIYLVNDVIDRKQDLLHPIKSKRPVAQGKISVGLALVISLFLVLFSFAGMFIFGNLALIITAIAYVILNLLYNLALKKVVILDVITVALGFELRVWAGSVIIGIQPSAWLQVFTFLLALFISFAKRREEILSLKKSAIKHRQVLSGYRLIFIDQLIAICGGIIILAYALYTLSVEIIRGAKGHLMIYTVPFVVYGVFRYLYLMYMHKEGGDPAEIVFSDKPLLFDLFLWLVSTCVILYL